MDIDADPVVAKLFDAARAARENAHAPYSNFKVGAAILAQDGRVFVGCNVENAAYPLGSCAEDMAIGAFVAGGGKRFDTILIVGGEGALTPCGGCRQKIKEFAGPDCQVYSVAPDGQSQKMWRLADLLPHAFDFDI